MGGGIGEVALDSHDIIPSKITPCQAADVQMMCSGGSLPSPACGLNLYMNQITKVPAEEYPKQMIGRKSLLSQWLTFWTFGDSILVGKIKFKLFFQGPLAKWESETGLGLVSVEKWWGFMHGFYEKCSIFSGQDLRFLICFTTIQCQLSLEINWFWFCVLTLLDKFEQRMPNHRSGGDWSHLGGWAPT